MPGGASGGGGRMLVPPPCPGHERGRPSVSPPHSLAGITLYLNIPRVPPDDLSCLTTPGVGCPGDGLLPAPLTRCIQRHTPSPCGGLPTPALTCGGGGGGYVMCPDTQRQRLPNPSRITLGSRSTERRLCPMPSPLIDRQRDARPSACSARVVPPPPPPIRRLTSEDTGGDRPRQRRRQRPVHRPTEASTPPRGSAEGPAACCRMLRIPAYRPSVATLWARLHCSGRKLVGLWPPLCLDSDPSPIPLCSSCLGVGGLSAPGGGGGSIQPSG